ncbi:MAG: hypothetical protein E6579_15115 [Clostridium sp.]|nr:hypothetical protein [Clostridium sp.]
MPADRPRLHAHREKSRKKTSRSLANEKPPSNKKSPPRHEGQALRQQASCACTHIAKNSAKKHLALSRTKNFRQIKKARPGPRDKPCASRQTASARTSQKKPQKKQLALSQTKNLCQIKKAHPGTRGKPCASRQAAPARTSRKTPAKKHLALSRTKNFRQIKKNRPGLRDKPCASRQTASARTSQKNRRKKRPYNFSLNQLSFQLLVNNLLKTFFPFHLTIRPNNSPFIVMKEDCRDALTDSACK